MTARVTECPKCGSGVKPHCPDTNLICRWQRCVRTMCAAVIDARARRAYVMDGSTARQVRWLS